MASEYINNWSNEELKDLKKSLHDLEIAWVRHPDTPKRKRRRTTTHTSKEDALRAVRENVKTVLDHPYNQMASHYSRGILDYRFVGPVRRLHNDLKAMLDSNGDKWEEARQRARQSVCSAIAELNPQYQSTKLYQEEEKKGDTEIFDRAIPKARQDGSSSLHRDMMLGEAFGDGGIDENEEVQEGHKGQVEDADDQDCQMRDADD